MAIMKVKCRAFYPDYDEIRLIHKLCEFTPKDICDFFIDNEINVHSELKSKNAPKPGMPQRIGDFL